MSERLLAHERLDVYRVALTLHREVEAIARGLPRGYGALKDQMRRAAISTVCNIAEGANRWSPKDKASRYKIALGECGECAATLDLADRADAARIQAAKGAAYRVASMLAKLVHSQAARQAPSRGGRGQPPVMVGGGVLISGVLRARKRMAKQVST